MFEEGDGVRWMRRLGVVLVAAAVLAACGSDGSTSTASGEGTTMSKPAASSSAKATVSTASSDEYGDILVDGDGRTLYLFEKDQGTTTACTGPCASNWPAFVDATPVAGDGVDQAKLSTADGEAPNQVVYNGHLLYYFAGDKEAGDVNGAEIPSWHPVDASGAAVEEEDAGSAPSVGGY
jgi:predicted lipoprotein with Yx(FWY)xxD motif